MLLINVILTTRKLVISQSNWKFKKGWFCSGPQNVNTSAFIFEVAPTFTRTSTTSGSFIFDWPKICTLKAPMRRGSARAVDASPTSTKATIVNWFIVNTAVGVDGQAKTSASTATGSPALVTLREEVTEQISRYLSANKHEKELITFPILTDDEECKRES